MPPPARAPAPEPLAALREYDKKRDFARTPEPGPEAVALPSASPRFMVHKHHARRLHYDLRLEIDGALGSWAVPRGPSYDPEIKRLAVQTEDHPLAYGDFEGRIPDGLYGAGESLVWDRGHFDTVPPGQITAMRKKGHVHFRLEGEKLRGEWHLLRTTAPDGRRARQGDASASGPKAQWLLVKVPDATADPSLDIVAARPESVLTGQISTEGPAPAFRGSAAAAAKPSMPKLLASGVLGSDRLHANQSAPPSAAPSRQLFPLFAAVDLESLPIDVARPRSLLELPAGLFGEGALDAAAMLPGARPPLAASRLAELLFLLRAGPVRSSKSGNDSGPGNDSSPGNNSVSGKNGGPGKKDVLGRRAEVALVLRELFATLGLHALASTAGPRALLVRAALAPAPPRAEARQFAARIGELLAAQVEAVRDGEVMIDASLNDDGAQAPGLLEPLPDAPRLVCTPIAWDEITPSFSPATRTVAWLKKHEAEARAAVEAWRASAAALPRVK